MENNKAAADSTVIIGSSRLKAEIAKPGEVYRGSRFDWTGMVTQVTLDDLHTFCVPEQYIPGKGSGGIGFSNEFGINDPVGYEETKVGDYFPKLGVGLLKRDSGEPYDFFKQYEILPFPIQVEEGDSSVSFIIEPVECNGYAMRYQKTVSVNGNALSFAYRLENAGRKPVVTSEYCHNFMGIDQNYIGRDYCLSFPYKVNIIRHVGSFITSGDSITWGETPNCEFYASIEGHPGCGDYLWQLGYGAEDTGVRETSRFTVSRCALWGSAHVVSPETFIGIDLKPGEDMAWTRSYEFFSGRKMKRSF